MLQTYARIPALASLALLAACSDGAAPDQQNADQQTAEQQTGDRQSPEWAYEGAGAPENWGRLNAEFATCETGSGQSPINLAGATPADLPDPQFDYSASPEAIENLGHTVQVNYQPGNSMMVGDTRYQLAQFHFHTPSEHQVDNREYPAELHFVHQGPNDELAVIGVLIEEGDENPALAPLWGQLPQSKGDRRQLESVQIDARRLLPQDKRYHVYQGSLTTPPCSEQVTWMVLNRPVTMSREQISALRSIIGTSNRPVQPLGDRELRVDS